jgi:hypothetical protein
MLLLTADCEEEEIMEFDLNLKMGERNVNNIFAYRCPQFKFQNGMAIEHIDAIVMHKVVCDLSDLYGNPHTGNNKLIASLLEDGSGVLFEEPSLPFFLIDSIDGLYGPNVFKNVEMTTAVKDAHHYTTTAIVQKVNRRTKKYIVRFPEDIHCKMGYMNQLSQGQKLTPFFNMKKTAVPKEVTGASADTEVINFLATYVIAIETEERRVLNVAEDGNNEIKELFSRMSVG